MQCLEKYRSNLVRDTNRQLRIIAESPDESAVHDFRVGIKRLTALYGLLAQADENISVKKLLKPYRVIFKKLGSIRDAHIAIGLIEDLATAQNQQYKKQVALLRSGIRRDYRNFHGLLGNNRTLTLKLPTIRATGISSAAISRHKSVYLDGLISQLMSSEKRKTIDGWHRKRILLKRYRHVLEAFSLCPGQAADPRLLKQISLLEQLLGDWHDRVVTAALLHRVSTSAVDLSPLIRELKSQERILLGSAKIYLAKFAQSQQDSA